MDNVDVARLFEEVADLLEIQNENAFRIRAYRTAARTIETMGRPVAEMVRADGARLAELPGIGEDLAGKIEEIVRTGRFPLLEQLARKVPETLVQMMRIEGVGPKRARLLYENLGLKTLADLEKAAKEGRLSAVRGFGKVLEMRILRGCAEHRVRASRCRLSEADVHVQPLLAHLAEAPGVEKLEVAGSYRRRKDTVGDVDILVAARRPEEIARRFVSYPEVARVLARGESKCSILLRSGLQSDLRIVPPESYGAALHYFTGSKAHNIAIRTLGVKKHLKINEYGVFRGRRRVGGRSEEEIFRAVGLPWIPPELREARGEIEAAREGKLPKLVDVTDIRGDLQMHTDATDGKNTLAEMVEASRARGYEYVAVTDHTHAVRVAGGLSGSEFRRQFRRIETLNRRLSGITILKGAEVDILPDGRLDLDEETLADLDVVLVSVHSKFHMTEGAMTERVLRALQHPRVRIFAHPTGRILGRREPYPIDLGRVARAAADLGVLLEINAQPDRLDLNDVHVKIAREAGARFVVSTDAHRIAELDFMRYGIDQARRGWCTAADVANTRPLEDLRKLFSRPGRVAPSVGGSRTGAPPKPYRWAARALRVGTWRRASAAGG
ncbi:MAG TPA: DNA polymerase/3'-5' exonuclease PolX [Thermoanaerobaculia bacterium]|nr:DNA polymerase/3'-5' exonuclease PolX [Thermoanaerobaculia bacterium]